MAAISLFLNLLLFVSLSFAAGAPRCKSVFVLDLSKQAVNAHLALEAGLRYLSEPESGYTRQRDEQGQFIYIDSEGNRVTDPVVLERIEQLRIPPAWQEVWISRDALTHVQASGKDTKGRRQTLYHPKWESEVKDVAKFSRMERFGESIGKLHTQVNSDIHHDPKNLETRLATVVRLLEEAGIRIGGEKYAAENEHYGLTTFKVKHVTEIRDNAVTFKFIGKEGVAHNITVIDNEVAHVLTELVKDKNQDDLLFDVKATSVNKYIKSHAGSEFSAKDIRTWLGTIVAAKTLFASGVPHTETEMASTEKLAAVAASERLHNEPNTARDNYIDPSIFEAYRSGHLDQVFRNVTATNDRSVEELAVLQLKKEKRASELAR